MNIFKLDGGLRAVLLMQIGQMTLKRERKSNRIYKDGTRKGTLERNNAPGHGTRIYRS